jgi:hypothetical protein
VGSGAGEGEGDGVLGGEELVGEGPRCLSAEKLSVEVETVEAALGVVVVMLCAQ